MIFLGRAGNDGDPGSRGFPGRFGSRGAPGDPGKEGKPGDDGIKGEKGDIGDPGLDGRKGLDGMLNKHCYRVDRSFAVSVTKFHFLQTYKVGSLSVLFRVV